VQGGRVEQEPVDTAEVVRRGYDAVSWLYRADDESPPAYRRWIGDLRRRVPDGGRVLDVGCGCGVPVARDLSAAGYRVTGVDLSEVQVQRARTLVPMGAFIRGDVAALQFPAASFDAIVALYSMIHMPLDVQPRLLVAFATWLTEGGVLLLTAGAEAWTGVEPDWLGGGAPMWWSHPDTATYRTWLTDAGFGIDEEGYVPDGNAAHSLFWALRSDHIP
jgi:SAM-dependent methyltransferase